MLGEKRKKGNFLQKEKTYRLNRVDFQSIPLKKHRITQLTSKSPDY